jgi:hypothetical protein
VGVSDGVGLGFCVGDRVGVGVGEGGEVGPVTHAARSNSAAVVKTRYTTGILSPLATCRGERQVHDVGSL